MVAIVVALIAPLGAYLAAARKMSGQIRNSEAVDLWKESSDIRKWSTDRVKELDDTVGKLERRLTEVEHANGELAAENRNLIRQVIDLNETIGTLRRQILELTNLLETERANVTRLKQEAENSPRRRYSDPPIEPTGEDTNDKPS